MPFYFNKNIYDDPTVYCHDGNLNRSLKALKHRVQNLGVHKILKERNSHPGRAAWLRSKRVRAVSRLRKLQKKGR